jgi:hypothetical protein
MLLQAMPQLDSLLDVSSQSKNVTIPATPAQTSDATANLEALQAFEVYYQIASEKAMIEELAAKWTRGVSRGWGEVDAIVTNLKEEFTHDPTATVPEDCEDVVEHFLKSKSGPDYLFASTAAMLLRARGFPTRLVTGFYADPEDFEYATGQTIVRKEDLHTWLQVSIDGTHWISVEATPGFMNPIEDLNWLEWAEIGFWWTCRWLLNHPLAVLVTLSALAWIVWARIWIVELILTLWVAVIGSMGSLRSRTLWLVWLLQWRGKLHGKPRPSYKTLRSWLREAAKDSASVRDFLPYLERMLYAPSHASQSQGDNEFDRLYRLLLWGRQMFLNQPSRSST